MKDLNGKGYLRLQALLDAGTFLEINGNVSRRATDFVENPKDTEGDGVITGYGSVGGNPVYVFSQDVDVCHGSVGEMHLRKMIHLYQLALKTGVPVIGIYDSVGIRLEEATDALSELGKLLRVQEKASGVIPTLSMVFGKCGGGMAVSASLADFVFMEKDSSFFLNAPNTLLGNYEEKNNTKAVTFQSEETGDVDFVGTEEELLKNAKDLLSLLPANASDMAVYDSTDDLNRTTENLEGHFEIPVIATEIADHRFFVETKKNYGKDFVTGLLSLDGITVGVVGNNDKTLTPEGMQKAAKFIKFLDAFSLPILSFTNANRIACTVESEKAAKNAAAGLALSFAGSDVPKINVILDEAYGTPAVIMNSKSLSADMVFAYENAKVGIMESKEAAKIIGGEVAETKEKFETMQTALMQSKRGYVDALITPKDLRKTILSSLEMLFSKDDYDRKHPSI